MKEILLISGKGGTGKTSISAALGALAGNKAVVADCDVDAANLHLLYEPEITREENFYSGKEPVIDHNLCTKCGLCKEKCRFDAIYLEDGQYKIDEVSCEGCSLCFHICPIDAIRMEKNLAGKWYCAKSRFGNDFLFAHLGIGKENSGKLVTKVKQEAKQLADQRGISFIFVDGPPGIGCPVISSLSNVDVVLIVTEATQSGLHDLARLVELIEYFNLKAFCVINKSDLNEEVTREIKEFCTDHNIQIITEIPFHPVFYETLQEGKTVIESQNSEIIDKIRKIFNEMTKEENVK